MSWGGGRSSPVDGNKGGWEEPVPVSTIWRAVLSTPGQTSILGGELLLLRQDVLAGL